MVFKYAYDDGLIDKPVRFGQSIKMPSRKLQRLARQAKGPRMFEAGEIRKILDVSRRPIEAMILLGLNCGFGQTDVSRLPQSALDFNTRWVDYPRSKTGIQHRCPLWPETVKALNAFDTSGVSTY